jgi:putative phosphoribosyl transferase
MVFRDRFQAGSLLAQKLLKYEGTNGIVLALPRGGIPVGYVIAQALHLPLEAILAKKIGYPGNKEYAIGAVSMQGVFVDPAVSVSEEYIQAEVAAIREKLRVYQQRYMGDKKPADLKGKIVILTDDGIATGSTILASLPLIRKSGPEKIVLAVPVAPVSVSRVLAPLVDEYVCLDMPENFYAIGQFYREFYTVPDKLVHELLNAQLAA